MKHAPPPASSLERYLAFAFAGVDLLVEIDGQDRVTFAEGAFQARFGTGAARFVGGPLAALVADDQQDYLASAVAALRRHGRLPPRPLRLSDRARSPVLLAALAPPGRNAALTFSPVPEGLAEELAGQRRGDMLRGIEARLRAGSGGALTLVEVTGEHAQHEAVAQAVMRALTSLAPGALADQLGDGRFGVLTDQAPEAAATRRQVQDALAEGGFDMDAVDVTGLELGRGALTARQAVRAVHLALGRFAQQGSAGFARMGEAKDLPALIDLVATRAAALRGAIMARRFSLVFQPIVALADRRIHHHEALLRPDESEDASPAEFVAMAEGLGFSEELDLAVAASAVDVLAREQDAKVAINISGQSLESADFLGQLLQLLPRQRKLGGRLMVELTETAEIDRPETVGKAIATLRAAGHAVALDDFGAGHAGFGYLQRFAVDFIKIDGDYVHGAVHDPRDRAIVASVADLARSLDTRVIAERVETEDHARMVAEMGVEFGQGWLFGHPTRRPVPG